MSRNELILAILSLLLSGVVGGLSAVWHMPLQNAGWTAVSLPGGNLRTYHFLGEDCLCSDRIAAWVQSPKRQRLGEDWMLTRTSAGEWRTPPGAGALSFDWNEIRVVPWMLVIGENGQQLYAGGYDEAPVYGNRILEEIREFRDKPKTNIRKRSIRGCAVSRPKDEQTNILNWKKWIRGYEQI